MSKKTNYFLSKNNNFDIIRLFAAFQVMFSHIYPYFFNEPRSLPFLLSNLPGVPIFFFISGFLVSLSFENSSNTKIFYLNRILRIYPALIVCTIISVISLYVASYNFSLDLEFLKWFISQVSFLQFYKPEFLYLYGMGSINPSLWSISVEISFYAILPFYYYICKLNKYNLDKFLILSVILSLVISIYHAYKSEGDYDFWLKLLKASFLPTFWMFLIGVLFQRKWIIIYKFFEDKFLFWFFLFFCFCIYDEFYPHREIDSLINRQLFSFLHFFLLIFCVISFAVSSRYNISKWLKGNDISYGIYIYHMIIINFMIEKNLNNSFMYASVAIIITVVVALISWFVIEKPMLKRKVKSINRV